MLCLWLVHVLASPIAAFTRAIGELSPHVQEVPWNRYFH